jgi:ABC-type microcin C transport system permease subunit YejB
MAIPYLAGEPSTEMSYYEIGSLVTAIVVSGASLELLGYKAALDFGSPLDLQFATEVARAALGMKRQEANDIAKKLLSKYEDHLKNPISTLGVLCRLSSECYITVSFDPVGQCAGF